MVHFCSSSLSNHDNAALWVGSNVVSRHSVLRDIHLSMKNQTGTCLCSVLFCWPPTESKNIRPRVARPILVSPDVYPVLSRLDFDSVTLIKSPSRSSSRCCTSGLLSAKIRLRNTGASRPPMLQFPERVEYPHNVLHSVILTEGLRYVEL